MHRKAISPVSRWRRTAGLAALMVLAASLVQAADTGTAVTKDGPASVGIGKGEPATKQVCIAIDFKTAELVKVGDRITLKVTGEAPHAGLSIEVRAVMYVMQPDYWQMGLVACHPETVTAAGPPVPFEVAINVGGSVGRKGIELTGRSGTGPKRLDAPI